MKVNKKGIAAIVIIVLAVVCIYLFVGIRRIPKTKDAQSNETTTEATTEQTTEAVTDTAAATTKAEETTESATEAEEKMTLEIGETEDKGIWTQTFVYPSNIDDTFVIDICLPDDYDASKAYPIVYLTDCYWRRGDYPALKELYENGETREFILVGIGYPDDYDFDIIRVRDLLDEPDQFLKMIVEGVMPYIESNYKVDTTDRTFCGASFGGYFMVYSLFQSDGVTKGLFKNYIFASPALYCETNGKSSRNQEEAYYERTKELKENVYMSVGGAEDKIYYLNPAKNFAAKLEERNYEGLNFEFKIYEGEVHHTVWIPTLLDGLRKFLAK